jgi:ribosomal protein S18 acetylase RimI-like enzyme
LPEGELYATVDEADSERLRRLESVGFTQKRRELVLRVPTDATRWSVGDVGPPPGITFRTADHVDEGRLRRLDDRLRQDVPGTDGWCWDEKGFREDTYGSPDFDPAAYLVAVNGDADYVGIARVWIQPQQARLGFVGVRAEWRRRGLARALLAAVFTVLHERGLEEVRTEVDETNLPSRTLLARFGAQTFATSLELVREGTTAL